MRRVSVLLACLWLLGWSAGSPVGGAAAASGREVRLDAAAVGMSPAPPAPAATLLATLRAPAVTAATPAAELQIVSDTRYDVQPASSRVRITVDATISNTHRDTPPVRSYYDTGYLAVLPGTVNFAVTSPGATPTVSVRSKTATYTLLAIHFGRRLYGGHHTPLRLMFNLPDRGGTAIRDVRIGTSLIAFPVWSYATTGASGGSVTVVFPTGYNVQVQAGSIPGPTSSGRTIVYASGALTAPLSFYAYFVADRAGTFKETSIVVNVSGTQVPVVIRAWADDAGWGTRVASLVRRGLPALGAAVGLAYGGQGLVVEEAVSRTIGGYAGLFDPVAATIDVAYYADSFVVLHEAAHAWFNGRLVSERWISEGFASWYAAQAATALKVAVTPPTLSKELQASKIPLNAWAGVGRADAATEDYAYAATYQLAGLIAKRAGTAALHAVWEAAVTGEQAYQPRQETAAPEAGATPPDWRGLLDLLEERTGLAFSDLWTTWVVRPQEANLLAVRSRVRTDYAAAVAASGDWDLPPAVRAAMSAWQFDQAEILLGASQAVLEKRRAIEAAATSAGLTPPPTLRTTFESNAGPAAAAGEATAELDTIDVIVAAQAASRHVDGIFEQIGLLGLQPETDMAAARTAFEAGDLDAAQTRATTARAVWDSARDRGVQRFVSVVLLVVGVGVLLILGVGLLLRRRRTPARDEVN